MKIMRDGNSFAIEVEHEAQAEALEGVLKKFVQPGTADPDPKPQAVLSDRDRRDFLLVECLKLVAASIHAETTQRALNYSFDPRSLEETAREVAEAYFSGIQRFDELIAIAFRNPSR